MDLHNRRRSNGQEHYEDGQNAEFVSRELIEVESSRGIRARRGIFFASASVCGADPVKEFRIVPLCVGFALIQHEVPTRSLEF